jgi:Fur family ferric uptake transcriptional regulator
LDGEGELRMTRQRRVILEELRRRHWHPTADELHRRVRRRLPRISLATVYRNLELLSERGVIRRLDAAGEPRRYDPVADHDCHVRCERCGRVDDLDCQPPGLDLGAFAGRTGYRITGHRFELVGLCPRCKGKA